MEQTEPQATEQVQAEATEQVQTSTEQVLTETKEEAKEEVKKTDLLEDEPKHETIGKPEKYDFSNIEGAILDENVSKMFGDVASELDLSQSSASKILQKMSPVLQKHNETVADKIREDWAETSRKDENIGGDNLKNSLSVAKKALNSFATPELKEFFNQTGLGNHPEIIRLLYKVGKATSEDTSLVSGASSRGNQNPNEPKTFDQLANSLYPSHN